MNKYIYFLDITLTFSTATTCEDELMQWIEKRILYNNQTIKVPGKCEKEIEWDSDALVEQMVFSSISLNISTENSFTNQTL